MCNLIGRDVEQGGLPNDESLLGPMSCNLGHGNAKLYLARPDLESTSALTPTLSPRRGSLIPHACLGRSAARFVGRRQDQPESGSQTPAQLYHWTGSLAVPSPGVEGWGEGERLINHPSQPH